MPPQLYFPIILTRNSDDFTNSQWDKILAIGFFEQSNRSIAGAVTGSTLHDSKGLELADSFLGLGFDFLAQVKPATHKIYILRDYPFPSLSISTIPG